MTWRRTTRQVEVTNICNALFKKRDVVWGLSLRRCIQEVIWLIKHFSWWRRTMRKLRLRIFWSAIFKKSEVVWTNPRLLCGWKRVSTDDARARQLTGGAVHRAWVYDKERGPSEAQVDDLEPINPMIPTQPWKPFIAAPPCRSLRNVGRTASLLWLWVGQLIRLTGLAPRIALSNVTQLW